jgi:hypothetical protein
MKDITQSVPLMLRRSKDRPSFRVSFTLALCIAAGLVFLGFKAVGL